MQNLFMDNSLPVATTPGIFGTGIPSIVAFTIALLLFLLPFAEIKCKPASKATTKTGHSSRRFNLDIGSSMVTLTNTGFGIAIGGGWKSGFGGAGNLFGSDRIGSGMDRFNTQRPNPYAIAALVLGVAGLIFSVVKIKGGAFIAMVSGALAAVALVGLLFDLMKKVKNPVNDIGNTGNETADWSLDKMRDVALSVNFTPWFYVTIIAFLAAAFFSYKRQQLIK
jgi:hypothetical protein